MGARTAAEAALALVRGPLLADEPDAEWAADARSAADAAVAEVRRVAATAALATGQVGDAAAHADRGAAGRPLRRGGAAHPDARARGRRAAGVGARRVRPGPRAARRGAGRRPGARDPRAARGAAAGGAGPAGSPDTAEPWSAGPSELRVLDAELERRGPARGSSCSAASRGPARPRCSTGGRRGAAARGAVVLRGRAEEGELALQPVLDALAGRLADVAPDEWAGAQPGCRDRARRSDALSLRVFAHLDDAVRSLPAGTGTALVLDDADGADPVTWAWLAHVRRRRELPLLVVVALRDPAAAGVEPGHRSLAVAAAGRRRGGRAGRRRTAPRELLARSGGNPLLLTELARVRRRRDPDEVPGSLREAVAGRLRRTGAADADAPGRRRPRRHASTSTCSPRCSGPRRWRCSSSSTWGAAGVPRRAGGRLAFRHELVRLAVAAEASAARRAWLHRRAAEVLRVAAGRASARAGPARPRGRRPADGGRGAGRTPPTSP